MKRWRSIVRNLQINTLCAACAENLKRIEQYKLSPTEIIVITPDGFYPHQQHIQIFDTNKEEHRNMKLGDLI